MDSAPASIHRKEFNFLWTILAISILSVVMFFAYSSLFLTPSFTRLVSENTESTAILIGTHIQTDLFQPGKPFAKDTLPAGFEQEIAEIVRNFHLRKIKVFTASGETIFSTEAKDIGVINEHDYFHDIVAHGKPFSKIVQKNSKSLEGQQVTIDVAETYVPAMAGDTFLGAFEIYLDITAPKASLDNLVKRSNHLLQAISAGLLLVIVFITRRARANILARHQAETKIIEQSSILEETNKDLSILNEISAVISRSIDMDRLLAGTLEIIQARFSAFSEITHGGIFLVDGDKLALATHLGHDEEFLRQHQRISINDCLCGKAARTGKIIFSTNSTLDPDHTLCSTHGSPHGHIIIPLTALEKVVGVLYLYTDVDVIIIDKEDLLQSIGRQIGLAINNVSLYQQTKNLSLSDQLTGLPNRRYLEIKLKEAATTAERYGRPLSAAMIDIDFFKKYNDTMGHAAGDQILTTVGALLRQEIRESDFAARYGGEEFLVLMPETDRACASSGLERIRAAIEQKAGVTISIGGASFQRAMSVEQLVKEADDALYRAKANGRNRLEWIDSIPPRHETTA